MQNPEQIVSWITENNYSKQREFIYFFLSLSIPAVISYYLGFYKSKSQAKASEIEKSKNNNLLRLSHFTVPCLLFFALLKLDINGQIDLYHEGERLQLNGLPYKDLYIQHGLILNYLLPKLASWLFSESVEGIRRIFSLLEPVAYIILYFVGLSFFRGKALIAILPPLLCSGLAYWVGLREGLCIAVLLSLLNKRVFLAGLLSGLAFWFSVDYGLYAIFSSLSFFILRIVFEEINFNAFRGYLSGLALSVLPVLLIFAVLGNFGDFLNNLHAQISYQSLMWGKPFIEFNLDLWSEAFRIYASILILVCSCCYLAYKLGKKELFCSSQNSKLLLITLFAIFFFRTALGRSDYGHWIDGSSLIIFLLFAPFDSLIFSTSSKRHKVIASFCFILLLAYLNNIHAPLQKINNRLRNYFPEKLDTPKLERIGRIKIPEDQLKTIFEVKNYIETNSTKEDYIYDFANQGGYYFLLNRPAPTKYFNVVYAATESMQNEVIRELTQKKPKLVIFSTGTIYDGIDGIPASKRHQIIYDYIAANYHQAKIINNTKILLRN